MPELLSPAGDMRCVQAACAFGADAIYVGGPHLQLRAAKAGFTAEGFIKAVKYAHAHNIKIYAAANSFLDEDERDTAYEYAKFLAQSGVDAAIVSDMGLFRVFRKAAPDLELHVSTQANCINSEAANTWHDLGASRVILGRECTLEQIKKIRDNTPPELQIECFVHGAMCMSFSGRCILSAYLANRSANKGGCTQPCRWKYVLEEETRPGMYFPIEEDARGTTILSSHDLCCASFLNELAQAGVDSFKIEGRMKSEYYVATVVNAYRSLMDGRMTIGEAMNELNCVTHRPYSTGFYYSELKYGHDNRGDYLADCVFMGTVNEVQDGRVTLEQHGTFAAGDTLEVLTPGIGVRELRIEDLTDEYDLPAEVANRAGHIYHLRSTMDIHPGDILRKRVKRRTDHIAQRHD